MLNYEVNSAEVMDVNQEPLTEYQQSQLLEVGITGDEETGYTADLTVTEISAAVNAGCPVLCRKGASILPLVKIVGDDVAEFASTEGNTFKSVTITDTTVSYCEYTVELDAPQRYFQISEEGEVSLKADYRGLADDKHPEYAGNGSEFDLPDMLVIPNKIGDITVTSLTSGMFYNNKQVKGITLPAAITEIPEAFCSQATNLQTLKGTENITSIGGDAFLGTKIKNALFPNLLELKEKEISNQSSKQVVGRAFMASPYLEVVDLGKVPMIPRYTFHNCVRLRKVIWSIDEEKNNTEISIKAYAFAHTHNLRELPLLTSTTAVEKNAFFYSSIPYSKLNMPNIPAYARPTTADEYEAMNTVNVVGCCNHLATKLSQINPAWAQRTFLTDDTSKKYMYNGCALFSVMHIHSAISGKYYRHPDEFVDELKSKGLSKYVSLDAWPGNITRVPSMFMDLGYRTDVCGAGTILTASDYQKLADELADGAYIYTQVSTETDENGGHAVVIYGINADKDVYVLDSAAVHEMYDFEPNSDFYTYTIPFPNIVGPDSDFIIVYPPENKSVSDWTVCAATNAFTSASKPSDYPENQVTVCRVVGDAGTPGSKQGILTAYKVGDSIFRTFMPSIKAALYLQIKPADKEKDEWLSWTECNHQDFTHLGNEQILDATIPADLPVGVNVSAIYKSESLGPLPEQTKGYMTAYHLFSSAANAREEWQPNGSVNKYVRYAIDDEHWGPWHVFTTTIYSPPAENTGSEDQ